MSAAFIKKLLFISLIFLETVFLFFLIFPQLFGIELSQDQEQVEVEDRYISLSKTVFAGEKMVLTLPFTDVQSTKDYPSFITVTEQKMTIRPTNAQVGTYQVKLSGVDDNAVTTNISIAITVTLSEIDFSKLKKSTETILGTYKDNFAVYVYDLKRENGFVVNGDQKMYPASISKVPYALLTLKGIDDGKYTLETTYPISDKYKEYTFDKMYYFEDGMKVSIGTYLEYLLQESDNTAMTHLEQFHGGTKAYNAKIADQLGITELTRTPHETTANAVGEVFRNIYDQKYLSKEMNEYLLDLMINTPTQFHDRIKAGVADFKEAVVAHKIGNLHYDEGFVYSDAGIVYGKYTDFVIVVLSQDIPTSQIGSSKIVEITELVYKNLN